MKLNDLIAEFHQIEELIIEGGGEVTPEIEAKLNDNSDDINNKLDNYENLKRYLKGQIEYLKGQEEHYKKRRNTLSNTIKWLSENQTEALMSIDQTKVKTAEYSFSVRKSESVNILESLIPRGDLKELFDGGFVENITKFNKAEIKKQYKENPPQWLDIEEKWSITAR